MKKTLMGLIIAVAAPTAAFGQTKMSKNADNAVQAQVVALEKQS